MKSLERSALVARSPEQMYALVDDVQGYPGFVPGCHGVTVLSRSAGEVVARLELARGGMRTALTTRNRLEPHHRISMSLVEGPLRSLEGDWNFAPAGEAGCEVRLQLRYAFGGGIGGLLVGRMIESTASGIVQAFVQRALADG
jgi:ribosome-associated toxin RatA of RatAB toxin-antitoxin module